MEKLHATIVEARFYDHHCKNRATVESYRGTMVSQFLFVTGKTNYTGVLSRSSLLKVYNEWLLPLQTRVTGIMTDNKSFICDLSPLEMVLSRCIELVEEKLNQIT
ncbi:aberrant root formation protein, putative [Medicago truncatula]|uniref:Aberrant root formation protein, putative n=1 Tax=Medicago truncatula TaxID=3880 RepID=G7I6Y4_MEDTR|nr:aberrant root formation protein, putative [Medicago truncatula]